MLKNDKKKQNNLNLILNGFSVKENNVFENERINISQREIQLKMGKEIGRQGGAGEQGIYQGLFSIF